ncbi:MAG: MraY family glycosyltransferase [bacterium]|nr:MraY family glycosyltransferase [bacterium]
MIYFLSAFILSVIFTAITRRLALRFGVIDVALIARKKHAGSIPLLGGAGIFLGFWLVSGWALFFTDLLGKNLVANEMFWVFLVGLVIMIVGFLDDKFHLPPLLRFIVSAVCVAVVVWSGVTLDKITNPFGGVIFLDAWKFVPGLIVFIWILSMMYTTKILDGLDGLSTGVSVIAAFMIFFIANGERWYQPDVAIWAAIFAGACLGFLIFNFHPAKIFLGEGGSMWLGFMLGVLSVISGGKIATALLVMAVPVLDVARVIIMRIKRGQPIWIGDREHLHFRLVDLGFGEKRTVLFYYLVAILFGLSTLILQSAQKLFMLGVLFVLMIILSLWLSCQPDRK